VDIRNKTLHLAVRCGKAKVGTKRKRERSDSD
jgi:hypothetical protein